MMNTTHPSQNTRVLIVDDELATQVLLKSTLDEAGYETATTFNAEEALACVADFDPSIAIVDIRLPGGMDGLELCHQLRQKHGVDVVVITGFSSEHGYVEAADSGAQFRLSISIGVAQCESEEDDKSLLKRADMAMYEAKGMGRNQVFLAPTVDRVE
ncbi:MAG: response regulator [Kiritimatiellae bacterium]|nr:response regulator [Kiritimatiellia bacterium]